MNIDGKHSKGTHLFSLFFDRNSVVYFDSFGNKIKDKLITHIIFSIQSVDSIMSWFYGIIFNEYMIAGKNFLQCTNLL